MSANIIETMQVNLGYTTLQKIDPNSQDTKLHQDQASVEKLGQGAIPAVMTALYKFSRTEAGCREMLTAQYGADWLSVIYSGNEEAAVEKVAQYADVTPNQARSHMENIAEEAVKLVKSSVGVPATPEKIKVFMNSHRHHILVYLPAALNMGDVLHDEGLDDKTNKMEGPVSNLMHKIENTFSDGDKKKGLF